MISRAIEVKAVSNDKLTGFETSQRKAREQVIGHLAKRLHCSLNFGGVGEEYIVSGMSPSKSRRCKLPKWELTEWALFFVKTAHVPLVGKESVPPEIHRAITCNMTIRNGVLLFSSAMLDVSRKLIKWH
mmetsp:Transcript_48048/g.140007  ORF Transcript_48048/g.140007 Transcript_48048/m.140007 type:complete len:129 (-) Transcript_48048:239-625(-)